MRARALLLLALLVAPLLPAPLPSLSHDAMAEDAAVPGVTYAWWDEAWHMRVPVLLQPRIPDPVNGGFIDLVPMRVREYPATVQVDFTAALRAAGPEGFGWPQDAQGRLSSFTFDVDSVRVVEQDRFKGCVIVKDRSNAAQRCFQSGDRNQDALVPATFSPGLWESEPGTGANPLFDAERNAVGTLQWAVRGAFVTARLYYVYFDILQNGAKPPAAYKPEDSGVLEGFQWVRAGTDVIGMAPGSVSGPGVILAQALYDNTTILISKYTTLNGGVEPAEMVRGVVNAMDNFNDGKQFGTCPTDGGASYQGTVCLDAPTAERFFFRVQANRPVVVSLMELAGNVAATWYPSVDGGIAGTQFMFRAIGNSEVNTDPRSGNQGSLVPPARLHILSLEGNVNVNAFDFSGNSYNNILNGDAEMSTVAGTVVQVFSSKPVLVFQAGDTKSPTNDRFSLPFVTPHGAPAGPHLVGWMRGDLTMMNVGGQDTALLLGSPLGKPEDPGRIQDTPLLRNKPFHWNGCGCGPAQTWRFDAKDETPLWAKAGEDGLVPLGGKGGREFVVSLQKAQFTDTLPSARLILIGLHNTTRVTVANASTGAVLLNTTVGLHGWVDKLANGQPAIPYGDWRITASKPVFAYVLGDANPQATYATYFSSRSEPPVTVVGAGEFHGFAVGWVEKVKTSSIAPGERVRLKLTLVNLGRGVGAKPITDDFTLTQTVAKPANATAPDVDLSTLLQAGVPSFQSRDVTLSVGVPADAATGTVYQVNLTARSKGNPGFFDTARVVVTVQIRYDFTLRFAETNSTAIQKIIRPDSATCIDVEARNTGTGDANVALALSPSKLKPDGKPNDALLGFDARVLPLVRGACDPGTLAPLVNDQGEPVGSLALPRGQAQTFTLYVRSPPGSAALPLEAELQGVALEDASVRQQVTATVFTNVEAKLRLTVENDTSLITPGANATYRLRLENIGDVDSPITYGTSGLLPLGWNITFLDAPALLRGRGTGADVADFTVNLTAAADAPVGMVVPVNVLATSAIIIDVGDASRAFKQSAAAKVSATVANNFTLEQPEAAPVTINPGEPFTLAYEMRSAANGPFNLTIAPAGLPRNWSLVVREPANGTLLAPGDRVQVRIEVTPDLATKAGPYEVGVAFLAKDPFTQGAQFRNSSILVRSTVDFRILPDVADLVLRPGGQRTVPLLVVNSGNLPIAVRLAASVPPGYTASFPEKSRVELQPGLEARVPLLLRAPAQAAETPQPVRLTGVDETSNRQKEVTLTVQTAQLDLAVTQVTVSPDLRVGEPAVATVTVQNTGTIPANNVSLSLVVNGRGVRNETLRALPPGEPRSLTLPWTVDEAVREVAVVVDPDDQIAEADESNNQARADLGKATPAPPAGVLVLLLAAAALLGAARLKPPRRGAGPHG